MKNNITQRQAFFSGFAEYNFPRAVVLVEQRLYVSLWKISLGAPRIDFHGLPQDGPLTNKL